MAHYRQKVNLDAEYWILAVTALKEYACGEIMLATQG